MDSIKNNRRKKKKRIDIGSLKDLKKELINEGYEINSLDENNLKKFFIDQFNISNKVSSELFYLLENSKIVYRSDNIKAFVEYIERIIVFEQCHYAISDKIKNINVFEIEREEYERESYEREEVGHVIKAIELIKDRVNENISSDEYDKLTNLEKEIEREHLLNKDIELLKKLIIREDNFLESYNEKEKIKTLIININSELNSNYIKHKEGTVEYDKYLISNIPRINRLIKNIDRYLENGREEGYYKINQSNTIQDSVNIAMVFFSGKVFKAISGKQDIEGYCKTLEIGSGVFKTARVNKLGEVGIGYNRINDSEKKILEEIDKEIRLGNLKDSGKLILCSKWEPCPSCYYVISQFLEKYPKIDMEIKFSKSYGS